MLKEQQSIQLNKQSRRWTIVLGSTLGVGGLIYIVLRIVQIPILNDEAISFFLYVDDGIFWPWGGQPDANNHLLNTLLTWTFYKLFGASTATLRLANLLAFTVYAAGTIRLALRQEYILQSLTILICLLASPIFLEYFGYSRGYGLSFACCIMLLNSLWRYTSKSTGWAFAGLAFWLLLTLASNLSFLLPTLCATMWVVYVDYKRKMWKQNVYYHTSLVIILCIFVGHIFWLKQHGALYHGNFETGFWDSVVESFLLSIAPKPYGWMQVLVAIGLVGTFGRFIHGTFSSSKEVRPTQGINFVFFGSIILFFLAHQLLGVNYPFGRVAVGYWIIGLLCLIISLGNHETLKWAVCIPLIVPLWSCMRISVDTSTPWYGEQIPHAFIERIDQESKQTGTPYITGHPFRHNAWAFYNLKHNGALGILWDIPSSLVDPEFQIIKFAEYTDRKDSMYNILLVDSISSSLLTKRKDWSKLSRTEFTTIKPSIISTSEFTQLLKIPIGENYEYPTSAELTIYLTKEPGELFLCTFQQADDGSAYDYYQYDIGRLSGNNYQASKYTFCVPLIKTDATPSYWIIHLWNPEKLNYRIDGGNIMLIGT